ncbi:MAG: helix-turn-helix domain-containing protein [bacterium]
MAKALQFISDAAMIPSGCRERFLPLNQPAAARMRLACDLLRFTEYPLKVIASRCGYATPFSFSRAFSKHNQCSPDNGPHQTLPCVQIHQIALRS